MSAYRLRRFGDVLLGGILIAAVVLQGFSAAGLAVIGSALFVVLGLGLWQCHERGLPLAPNGISLALAAFWGWCLAAAALAVVPSVSWPEVFVVGSLPLAYFCLRLAPDPDAGWRLLRAVLAAVLLLACAVSLYQLFLEAQPARSFFVQQNSQGAFLDLGLLVFAGALAGRAGGRLRDRRTVMLGALVFLAMFVVAAGLGRGPAIGLGAGLAALILLSPRHLRRRAAVLLLAIASVAFAAANLVNHGGVSRRFESAAGGLHLTLAGKGGHRDVGIWQRRVIWRATLPMLAALPWHGFGPGAFHVIYPGYSPREDSSGLQYAHNDYLQFLIELGWPGLVLVIVVMGAVTVRLRHALRSGMLGDARRSETAGLAGGMIAVAVHSLVSYDFQIVPILILFGLVLARFAQLTEAAQGRTVRVPIAPYFSRPMFAAVVVLGLSVPVGALAAVAGTSVLYQQARADMLAGRLEQADGALRRAAVLFDTQQVEYARALLYTEAVRRLKEEPRRRAAVYALALDALTRAERLDPFAADVAYGRGRLFEAAPMLSGPQPLARAAQAYRTALASDPRFFRARMALAALLARGGAPSAALRELTDGLSYSYTPDPGILRYVHQTIRMRRKLGDPAGGARLAASLPAIVRQLERAGRPWRAIAARGEGLTGAAQR